MPRAYVEDAADQAVASQTGKCFQLQGQREAPVGQFSRSYRGEENGEVEVTGFRTEPRG